MVPWRVRSPLNQNFRLPQSKVACVFINASTVFCSSDVQLATRVRNSIHSPQRERDPDVLHCSHKLLDWLGRIECWSHEALVQQPANTISHTMDIGQHSETNILIRHRLHRPGCSSHLDCTSHVSDGKLVGLHHYL